MRHDIPFPIHNDYEICHYLKNIWECGWLDEYSDEHFLIKAIENRLTTFQKNHRCYNLHRSIRGLDVLRLSKCMANEWTRTKISNVGIRRKVAPC